MNAFSLDRLYSETPNQFMTVKRQRLMFALGMRDSRRDSYDGEASVNNGYESDAYWAGRALRSGITFSRTGE